MIKEVIMYTAACDNCGYEPEFGDFTALSDKDSVVEDITAQGWHYDSEKEACYCEDCRKELGI